MPEKKRYYGKYRGTVINPVDPMLRGRVQALITLGGAPLPLWCEACTPYAGPGCGLYAIPPMGAGVWVEFEEGDPNKPIWNGCWWMEGEVLAMLQPDLEPPDPLTAPQTLVLRTPTTRLKLSALTGMATLESLLPPATPALPTRVQVTPAFVEVAFQTFTVRVTPVGAAINDGALLVI
jgi:Type VI secretion system/phage-baseplate injector OB domain